MNLIRIVFNKNCFQHKIASDPKYDGYQRGLSSMVYKFFDEKSALLTNSSGSGIANETNYQLASELPEPIIRKF